MTATTISPTSVRQMPGSVAVWVLIYAELSEFALFFLIYLVTRAHNPELFAAGPSQLNTLAGTLNTLVLVSSSFCIARAMSAIRRNDRRRCIRWLGLTIACGALYCGIKGWEYLWNEASGIHARSNLFFTLYYYLTFNHLLHVLVGMATLSWLTLRTACGSYDAEDHEGLENGACYWHMIDLAWIILFPLVYVMG
ncbi:cytochrome c oxidase subunit 3 family protein [Marinobacterium aestuariivivens]|uniref:Cytochrome c oxidase subunit 3 family protein n=1 Tax=Marinobacterium aestuariivivens TaxID=1698799 RepID=A0ABW1ZZW4_9GAMM